jgi:hypothetical protein
LKFLVVLVLVIFFVVICCPFPVPSWLVFKIIFFIIAIFLFLLLDVAFLIGIPMLNVIL